MATTAGIPVAGAAMASAVLTRPLMNNAFANMYAAAIETDEVATKADAKAWAKEIEGLDDGSFDAQILDLLATDYQKAEQYKQQAKMNRHAQDAIMLKTAILAKQAETVDQMTDAEVQRENAFEDPLEIEKTPDGKMKLSGDSERTLITNAVIETAQDCGIMDLSEFDMSNSHIEQVKKTIDKKLKMSGAAGNKDKSLDVVIDGLDTKIKTEQAKLAKEGTKASEEKMIDEATVAVMKEQGITDPSKVKDSDIQAKYTELYEKKIPGAKPSDDTQKPLDSLQKLKKSASQGIEQSDGRKAFKEGTSGIVTEKASEIVMKDSTPGSSVSVQQISARKSIMASKSKKGISEETSKALREAMKQKKSMELDEMLATHVEALDNIATNENGGVDSQADGTPKLPGFEEFVASETKADEVAKKTSESFSTGDTDKQLELLQLTTKLYRDNLERDYLTTEAGKKKTRKQMSLDFGDEQLLVDYARTIGTTKDGSKRFTETTIPDSGQIQDDVPIDDIIKKMKK